MKNQFFHECRLPSQGGSHLPAGVVMYLQTLSCFDRENANDNAVMSRSAVSFKVNYLEIKQNAMKHHHFWMVSKSS